MTRFLLDTAINHCCWSDTMLLLVADAHPWKTLAPSKQS